MKVTLPRGIASISGTISRSHEHNLIAKTFRKADGSQETRMYWMPKQQRSTPLSKSEIQSRSRFAQMAQEVSKRIEAGDRRPRKLIWADVKSQITNHKSKITNDK